MTNTANAPAPADGEMTEYGMAVTLAGGGRTAILPGDRVRLRNGWLGVVHSWMADHRVMVRLAHPADGGRYETAVTGGGFRVAAVEAAGRDIAEVVYRRPLADQDPRPDPLATPAGDPP